MNAILRIAPAASGKTTALMNKARTMARDLTKRVNVVVPGYLQVRAWRRLLAENGGAIGVYVFTFPQLYQQILDAAGCAYTRLSTPLQYSLVQSILDTIELDYYAPLKDKQGFITALINVIAELKAGRIWPELFAQAVQDLDASTRLIEISRVYTHYQNLMLQHNWADPAGMGWLTAEVLENDVELCRDWSVLYVDGFDDLTPVQVDVLHLLSERVPELIITLTGDVGMPDKMVHRRYNRTGMRLKDNIERLIVENGLPYRGHDINPAISHLETSFLVDESTQFTPCKGVALIAAPNRESEVRESMRWLKQRVVNDYEAVGNVALLARNIEPYRHHIRQIADEFGMPVYMAQNEPLSENPCVAALLNLFSLHIDDYPRQRTIDVWFSPYFDWVRAIKLDPDRYNRVQNSRLFHEAALWGKVIGGYSQWTNALALLSEFDEDERISYEDEISSLRIPVGHQARTLLTDFKKLAVYLTPPEGLHPYRDYVYWVENLIGNFTEEEPAMHLSDLLDNSSLGVLDNIYNGPLELRLRDEAAILVLKEILRGFIWAEDVISTERIEYSTFMRDLRFAVEGAAYHLPLPADQETIMVSDVAQVRGMRFGAAAIMGLAEGEFPAVNREDPFLSDKDRTSLRNLYGFKLNLSTESHEISYFYDAITRASANLLLTRPRLTETGAEWQPSPFWLEVQRLVDVGVVELVSDSMPDVDALASSTEGIYHSSTEKYSHLTNWVKQKLPSRFNALMHAAHIIDIRLGGNEDKRDIYEGNLTAYTSHFSEQYGPQHTWSPSRLESYSSCPFMFFTSSVLKLEPREEPEEGFDARQLGNIYHHIFESLYQTVDDPSDLEQLLEVLPVVSSKILDEAPKKEQFRVTLWWTHNRQEIVENVRQSLLALHHLQDTYRPYAFEQPFGLGHAPPLVVRDQGDLFKLRGYIDRVDQSSDGAIRIIDYKTSGPWEYTASAVRQGKKLQLPLYALAARDALGLGEPEEGFYWHVRDAQPSRFTLAKFGPEAAIHYSVEAAWTIIRAVRSGEFIPKPPRNGCPSYCPAADMCWQFQTGFR